MTLSYLDLIDDDAVRAEILARLTGAAVDGQQPVVELTSVLVVHEVELQDEAIVDCADGLVEICGAGA
jgi:hypothetical protein